MRRRRSHLATIACAALALWAPPAAHAEASPGGEGPPIGRVLEEPFFGDLDAMVERRVLRVLVAPSKTTYFLDGPRPRGIVADGARLFEEFLAERLGTGVLRVQVVLIPVPRDELVPRLLAGRGDLATGLSVPPDAGGPAVDYTAPLLTGVRDVVVTGSDGAPIRRTDDLAGRELWLPEGSPAVEALRSINLRLAERGLEPARVRTADPVLQAEDLLEMVGAGLLEAAVVPEHLGELWADVLPGLVLHDALAVREGGAQAWGLRPGSPQLKALADDFIAEHRKGTLLGNVLFRRYLHQTRWVRDALADGEVERFHRLAPLFERYAARYGFDWLLVAAQGYQESRLDPTARSDAGAVGVMQLLPSTAADVGITDLTDPEANVHAGVKYLRHLVDRYFDDDGLDPINRTFFAMAGYNAGPSRIARLRRVAAERGLDPDRWFDQVERVVAEEVGREPVRYVSNIYKYYFAYRRLLEDRDRRRELRRAVAGDGTPEPDRR
jgi:membrane-bound lytic murein transglycosylase MltF